MASQRTNTATNTRSDAEQRGVEHTRYIMQVALGTITTHHHLQLVNDILPSVVPENSVHCSSDHYPSSRWYKRHVIDSKMANDEMTWTESRRMIIPFSAIDQLATSFSLLATICDIQSSSSTLLLQRLQFMIKSLLCCTLRLNHSSTLL